VSITFANRDTLWQSGRAAATCAGQSPSVEPPPQGQRNGPRQNRCRGPRRRTLLRLFGHGSAGKTTAQLCTLRGMDPRSAIGPSTSWHAFPSNPGTSAAGRRRPGAASAFDPTQHWGAAAPRPGVAPLHLPRPLRRRSAFGHSRRGTNRRPRTCSRGIPSRTPTS
jgi:hypothetical protein